MAWNIWKTATILIFLQTIIWTRYKTFAEYPSECTSKDSSITSYGPAQLTETLALGEEFRTIVDLEAATDIYGYITRWMIQPNKNYGTIKVGLYRNFTGNFSIVGENTLEIREQSGAMQIYEIPRDEQIFVEPGDFIGYRSTNNAIRMDTSGRREYSYATVSSEDDLVTSEVFLSNDGVGLMALIADVRPITHTGCYPEKIIDREMIVNYGLYNGDTLRIGECYQICKNLDYKYSSVRDGGACLCGATLTQTSVAEAFCDEMCGINGDKCGGDYHGDIFVNPDPIVSVDAVFQQEPVEGNVPHSYEITHTGSGIACKYYLKTNDGLPEQALDLTNAENDGFRPLRAGTSILKFSVADLDGDRESVTKTYHVSFGILTPSLTCPDNIASGRETECDLILASGSNVQVDIDFGTSDQSPSEYVLDTSIAYYGSTEITHDVRFDEEVSDGRYAKFNSPIKEDGILIEVHAHILNPGTFKFEILRPVQESNMKFCYKSYSNIPESDDCEEQLSAWRRQCTSGKYSFRLRQCLNDTDHPQKHVPFPTAPPTMAFEVVKQYEFSKTVTGFAKFSLSDNFEVKQGDVIAWYKSGTGLGLLGFVKNDTSDFYSSSVVTDTNLPHNGFAITSYSHNLRAVVIRPIKTKIRHVYNLPANTAYVDEVVTVTLTNNASETAVVLTANYHLQEVILDVCLLLDVTIAQKDSVVSLYIPDHFGQTEATYRFNLGNGDEIVTSERNITYIWNTTGTYLVKATGYNEISTWSDFQTIIIQDNITGLAFINTTSLEMRNPDFLVEPTGIGEAATILWDVTSGSHMGYNVTIGDTEIHLLPGEEFHQASLTYDGDKTITDVYALNTAVTRSVIDLGNAVLTASSGSYSAATGWSSATAAASETVIVDLKKAYILTGIIMLGSNGMWTTSANLMHSGHGINYLYIPADDGNIFEGNSDAVTPLTHIFKQPVVARYFKYVVQGYSSGGIGLKFDLLGRRASEVCRDPLGMEDSTITDSQITASSNVQAARRNSGTLWQPSSGDSSEWIQVDLQEQKTVAGVAIQKDLSNKNNALQEFRIGYSLDGVKWRNLRTTSDLEIWTHTLSSSPDVYDEWVDFVEPLTTRYLRIIPIQWAGTPSMSFEIYGCEGGRFNEIITMADSVTTASGAYADDATLDSANGWHYTSSTPTDFNMQFDDPHLIIGLVTQGNPTSNSWVLTYTIHYSIDGEVFTTIYENDDAQSTKTFTGNIDSTTRARAIFPYPVLATHIRMTIQSASSDVGLRYALIGSKVPISGIEKVGIQGYTSDLFRFSSGTYASLTWDGDVADTDPWIYVDQGRATVITGVMLFPASASDYVTEFQCSYSDDAFNWNFLTDHDGEHLNFTGMSGASLKVVMFPEVIIARFLRITVNDFATTPKLQFEVLGHQGRGLLRFTAHDVTDIPITITGYNDINSLTISSTLVYQERITFYYIVQPAPFPIENDLLAVVHTDLSTNVMFEGHFDSSPLDQSVFSYNGQTRLGLVDIPSDLYSTIGDHYLTVLVQNLITGPYEDSIVFRVQYLVTDLNISVSEEYIKTDYVMEVYYDMDRGSDMNCTINMDDGTDYDRQEDVMLRPNNMTTVSHTYRNPGTYVIVVTCVNDVSNDTTEITVIVQNEITLMEETHETLVEIPYENVGVLDVNYVFSGNSDRKPTDAVAEYNFTGDHTFSVSIDLVVGAVNEIFTHGINITKWGSYEVNVTVFNLVTVWKFSFHLEVDEIINGLEIQLPTPNWKVDEPAEINYIVTWGSRMTFDITYDDDSSTDRIVADEHGNSTTHPYSDPGFYRVSVTVTNTVSTMSYTMNSDLVVQHPVVDFYVGARTLNRLVSNNSYVNLHINLFRITEVPHPTDAYISVQFGNDDLCPPEQACLLDNMMENLKDSNLDKATTTNILSIAHTYNTAKLEIVSIRIWNLVSDEVFTKNVYVFEKIKELEPYLKYSTVFLNRSVFNNGSDIYDNFVHKDVKYVPLEFITVLDFTIDAGTNMTYICDFGDTIQPPLDSIMITHDQQCYYKYSKPGEYTVKLNASNPVHFVTTSVTFVVQASVNETKLVGQGSTSKNMTTSFDLHLGWVPTDACYYINFIDEKSEPYYKMFLGNFGTCNEEYPAEMKHPDLQFSNLSSSMTIWEEKFEQNALDTDLVVNNTFMTKGGYSVLFIVHNNVSRLETTVFQTVTNAPCKKPVVNVASENMCSVGYPCYGNTNRRKYKASVDITVSSAIEIDCKSTNIANNTWTLYENSEIYLLPSEINTVGVGLGFLSIPRATLGYGTYRAELNVTMVGEIGLWAIDHTEFTIVPSELEIGIDGGSTRSLGWDQTVEIDAGKLSKDPDVKEQTGIQFFWFCRRMTHQPRNESLPKIFNLETFAEYNDDYTEVVPNGESVINEEFESLQEPTDKGGCFGRYGQDGSPIPGGKLNYTTSKFIMNTTGMYWDMIYEVKLIIKKESRPEYKSATFTQQWIVSEGDPPDMKINGKINCGEKINPTSKFALEGKDRKWKRHFTYYYRWEIYHQNDDDVFQMVRTDAWLPLASTAHNESNLGLYPGLFEEYETYKIKVIASRNKDFSNPGEANYEFLTNERPSEGNCTIEPAYGVATITKFTMACYYYVDEDNPLTYQFSVRSDNVSDWEIFYDANEPIMSKAMPLGPGYKEVSYEREIRVRVTDSIGTFRDSYSLTVIVAPVSLNYLLSKAYGVIEELSNLASAGDSAAASNLISSTSGVINVDSNITEGTTFMTNMLVDRVEGIVDLSTVTNKTSQSYQTFEDTITGWFDENMAPLEDTYLETQIEEQQYVEGQGLIVTVGIIFSSSTQVTPTQISNVLADASQTTIGYQISEFQISVLKSEDVQQSLTELRTAMVAAIYELTKNLRGKSQMRQVSSSVALVAQKPDQLTVFTKADLLTITENFAIKIDSLEDASAEDIEDSSGVVLGSIAKLFAPTTNDVDEEAAVSGTTSEDLTDDTDSEEEEEEGTEEDSTSVIKALKISNSEKANYVMAMLQVKIASQMVAGQDNVVTVSKGITSDIGKTFTTALGAKTYGGSGGGCKLPDDPTVLVGTGNDTTNEVECQSSVQENNLDGADGGGFGMVCYNDTGQQMVVELLLSPIVVEVCRSEQHLGPKADNSSNDIEWKYLETTLSGTPMQLTKLENVGEGSALFINIEAIEEEPPDTEGEDAEVEDSYDYENFTLYIFISVNKSPKEDDHDVNCTLQQSWQPLYNVTKPPEYYDRPWNGTRYAELIDGETRCFFSNKDLESYLNESSSTINIGVRHVWGGEEEDGEEHPFSPLRYSISFYTTSCMYYDTYAKIFKFDGMEVLPTSDRECTRCNTYHLTSFGGGFSVPMNTIDLSESAFTKLGENPVVFVFMTCCICIYTVVIIWARKEDQRDKSRAGVTPMSDNDPRHTYNYEITFFTGVRKNSSTSAHVSFIIQGEGGETGIRVVKDKKRKLFERGGIDSFLMSVPKTLGTMVHLRIWHDNKGKYPSWFLSRASIKDLQTNRMYYFMLDKWLAVEEDDGQIERIVPVAGMSELTSFGHLFYSRTRRNLSDAHLWFSVFMRPAKSTFTRCERATCCLSLLFCTMMANIFFYGQDVTGGAGGGSLKVGPIELSLGQIVVGVISSLMVVPANVIIVQLFRLSKPMGPNNRCCGCCRPRKNKNKYLAGSRVSLIHGEQCKKKNSLNESDELKEQLDLLEAGSRIQSRAGGASRASCVSNSGIDVMESPEKSKESKVNEMKPVLGYKKTKKKKKKDPNPLPWWCAIFGWIFAWMTIGLAFWMTIEVAGGFGKEKATEWLTTVGISLAQDIIVSQPIKVLLLATIFSLIIKTPDKEDNSPSPHLEKDEEWLHERLTEEELADPTKLEEFEKQRAAELATSLPPDEDEINEMREYRMKEMEMTSILREVTIYMLFLYILMTVSFGNTDPAAFAFRETMLDSFVHASYHGKMPFSSIASRDYFWNYTQNVFIPSLFAGNHLNGELNEDGLKQALLADHTSSLVGIARLRQLRVIPDLCEIPEIMQESVDSCRPAYGAFTEDDRYFHERWVLANQTHPPEYKGLNDAWRHQSWFDLGSLPYWGIVTVYGGGGYVIELGKTVEDAWAIADYLRATKWVDQYTRAVFFEFTVYNPVINFYAVSYMIAEFLPQGGAIPYFHFQTLKLDRYFGPYSYIVLAAEAGLCVFTLWFAFKEFKHIKKQKKKYFKSLSNLAEFITLVLSITAFVMYMYRTFVAKSLMTEQNENPTKFLNFQYVGQWDQMFCWMIGLILFISTIKFMKLLRFNKRMLLLSQTIQTCWLELLLFFMMFAVIFASYACAGFMLFGNNMIDYYTMITTLESLFATLLGNFNFDDMVGVNRVLGPIFFFSFTLTIVFVLMNMFITIINEAFSVTKEENAKMKNDVEIIDFMVRRFKETVGFAERRNLKPKRRHKYVEGIEPIQIECDEMQQKLVLMVDQLNDFIRKEKVEELGEDAVKSGPRPIYTTD
ncbi:uncharacterized protein [Antedon mediterranea]|uniref:uncharacterized protein n=1 Tax=Antedon mediterranea TaxID=105859 RepID=UPI003AF8E568